MKFKFNILSDINYDLNVGNGISDFIIFRYQTFSLVQRTVYVVMYLFAILLEKVSCSFYILLEINN